MRKIYVTCSVCGKEFRAKVQCDGDETFWTPRHHWRVIPSSISLGLAIPARKESCPGCHEEGENMREDEKR